jgi:hypothetical protein
MKKAVNTFQIEYIKIYLAFALFIFVQYNKFRLPLNTGLCITHKYVKIKNDCMYVWHGEQWDFQCNEKTMGICLLTIRKMIKIIIQYSIQ